MPTPTPLVVKPGSKTFDRFSAGIPTPVSEIAILTKSPFLLVLIVMVPRSGMAWAALTSRFMKTWFSAFG